jgi:hypothetical protein
MGHAGTFPGDESDPQRQTVWYTKPCWQSVPLKDGLMMANWFRPLDSMAPKREDRTERRKVQREQKNRTVQVRWGKVHLPCSLVDVSDWGCRLAHRVPALFPDQVTIEFPSGKMARGRVLWRASDTFGVEFLERHDCSQEDDRNRTDAAPEAPERMFPDPPRRQPSPEQTAAPAADPAPAVAAPTLSGPRNRRATARRPSVQLVQVFLRNGYSVDCVALDFSDRGARLAHKTPLIVPDFLTIRLPNRKVTACRVRWRNDNSFGVEFVHPL